MNDLHLALRGIAHDINGIMARAGLAAEQLREHDDSLVKARADRIAAAIDRVAEICRDQLADSLRPGDAKVLGTNCLEALIRQVWDMVELETIAHGRLIDFRMSVAPNSAVSIRPASLFRVLFNLTYNAACAINKSGGSRIDVSVTRAFGRVYFDVSDNGPGLPEHVLAYLYPRADGSIPRSGPIGSGLITAASLASEMNGELRLVSSNIAGTTFFLSLPQITLSAFGQDHPKRKVTRLRPLIASNG